MWKWLRQVFRSKYRKLYEQSELTRAALIRRHQDLIHRHEEQSLTNQMLLARLDKSMATIKALQEEIATRPKRKSKAKEARQYDA